MRHRWTLLNPSAVATRRPNRPDRGVVGHAHVEDGRVSLARADGRRRDLAGGQRGPQVEALVRLGAGDGQAGCLAALQGRRRQVFDETLGGTRGAGCQEQQQAKAEAGHADLGVR